MISISIFVAETNNVRNLGFIQYAGCMKKKGLLVTMRCDFHNV